jgi:hypothetical protein
MSTELKFHFPVSELLRFGQLIVTAGESHAAALAARLATNPGIITQSRTLLGTVAGNTAAQKGKRGTVGTLTKDQNAKIATLNRWMNRARETAARAFEGQAVKLTQEFLLHINDPRDLASILDRARTILASTKDAANLPAMKSKGWIDADTAAFQAALDGLVATDTTQETGKGSAKDATGIRNNNANTLFDNLLTLQNAANLQWLEEIPGNAGIRDEFCLRTFPPPHTGGSSTNPTPPPAPPAP